MAVTTTTRLGVTRWSSGTDAFSRSQMDDSHAALETNAAMYAQDVVASRPSAGKSGRVFWATDESKLYYDNGVTWTSIGSGVFLPLSGGTLSGALTAATSYTVTGGSVLAATALTIGSSTTSSTLTAGAGTHSLEFGRRDGSSSSPVMNFHSSGNDISYDSRIVASGGSGSVGQGILSLTAAGGINLNSASVSSAGLVTAVGITTSSTLTLSDANVVLGTTTGTKIGTSTSQKLGFFNSTPIVQPSGDIFTALTNLGLITSPSLASTSLSDTSALAYLSGAAFTGDITVATGATTGRTRLSTDAGVNAAYYWDTGSTSRWLMRKNSDTESGSDAGSNLELLRSNDAGSVYLTVWSVNRATGATTYTGAVTFADVTFAEAKNIALGTTTGTKIGTSTSQKLGFFNSTPIVKPSGNLITALSNLGLVSSGTLNGTDITSGIFNVSGTFSSELKVYGTGSTSILKTSTFDATGQKKVVFGQGASQVARWEFVVTGAESGSNTGNAFALDACDDSGTKIDSAISIVRASGGAMTVTRPLNATGGITAPILINAQTGTSYTLVLGDAGYQIEMNNASANTLTVPLNSSVAFPIGTQIAVLQTGAGQTTIAATGGVTINGFPGLKLVSQWAGCTLTKRATNTWVVQGGLSS